jgi:hypothetical protein
MLKRKCWESHLKSLDYQEYTPRRGKILDAGKKVMGRLLVAASIDVWSLLRQYRYSMSVDFRLPGDRIF